MLLTSTSDLIRLITSGSSPLNVQASWADQTTSTFTPGRTNSIIASATTTTIIGSPGVSTQRQVKTINISNTDPSVPNNITAQHYDGSLYVNLIHTNLLGGYTLQYAWDQGWSTLDNNGNLLTAIGTNAAGSDSQIQFNNGGAFIGASADFTWNSGTNELGLNGQDTSVLLQTITTEPLAPADGVLRFYTKSIGGRTMPKWVGPAGIDTPFQPALFGNNIIFYCPYSTTTVTPNGFGAIWAKGGGAGTVSTPTLSIAAPTFLNSTKRTMMANAVTTTNQAFGIIATAAGSPQYWRGNAAGLGGWFFFSRFGMAGYLTGTRLFAGLTAGTAEVVSSDTVANNSAGLFIATTNTGGDMNFVTRDAATTHSIYITGATLVSGSMFDVYIYARPNDSTIHFRVDQLDNGSGMAYGTLINSSTSSNLPVATTFLGPQVEMSNGANIVANTVAIAVNRIYVESDH